MNRNKDCKRVYRVNSFSLQISVIRLQLKIMKTTMSLKQISKQALSLNGLQRAKLAEMLVISLDVKTLSSIDKSWIQIASDRREELTSGKIKSIEGKKALAQAKK